MFFAFSCALGFSSLHFLVFTLVNKVVSKCALSVTGSDVIVATLMLYRLPHSIIARSRRSFKLHALSGS